MSFMPSIFLKIAVLLTFISKSSVGSKLFRTLFSIFSVFSFQVKSKCGPGNRHKLNMFSIYLFYMEERWVNFLLKLQNCYLLLNRFFQRLCKRVNLFKDLLVYLLQLIVPCVPNSFLKYFFRHCLQQRKSSLRFSCVASFAIRRCVV